MQSKSSVHDKEDMINLMPDVTRTCNMRKVEGLLYWKRMGFVQLFYFHIHLCKTC